MAWEEAFEDGRNVELPAPAELGLSHLRPFAMRVLLRLLVDDEAPVSLRYKAAELVVSKTKEPDAQEQATAGQGSDAVVDLEAERLWRDLQKHS